MRIMRWIERVHNPFMQFETATEVEDFMKRTDVDL
jgi:hypothetical protein